MTGDHTHFVKTTTGVTENWAKSNCFLPQLALEAAQNHFWEARRSDLNRIKHGQYQLSMTCEIRAKPQPLRHAIAWLSTRELPRMELRGLLSESVHPVGELKDESDYENAMNHNGKENADDARSRLRRLWKCTTGL